MHKIEKNKVSIFFAKLLIFFSFVLIIIGIIINYYSLDPIKDFSSVSDDKNTVSVTPVGSDDEKNNNPSIVSEEKGNEGDTQAEIGANSNSLSNNNSPSNTSAIPSNNSVVNPKPSDNSSSSIGNIRVTEKNPSTTEEIVSQAAINNSLRNEIQNRFGIVVKYGDETIGYSVSANGSVISTTPISNDATINDSLNNLKNTLSLYPNGFFQEIRQGGIPLTVYLINNYSETGVTGITDSSYNYANISIAVKYPFAESFFHESYHYIERYMFKNGAVFNDWDSLNPTDFVWGVSKSELAYSNTKNPNSYFVNNYAQTSQEEDRASTFEYMMDYNRATCFNYGSNIWKKAKWMADNIDAVFNTVSPSVLEYWERYLNI